MAEAPRRRIVGLSTKMYFSLARTGDFTQAFLTHLTSAASTQSTKDLLSSIDIFIIPDFISLRDTARQLAASPLPIWTGAQDVHTDDAGAFTGEVSAPVLAEAGVRIVEVGHAERRRLFGETDAITAGKAAAVARNGMIPLVCIGEKTTTGNAVEECRVQVEGVVVAVGDGADIVLAYEPVWAIGAAQPAGEEHVLRVVEGIRGLECVRARKGVTRVVYGGSAGPGLYEKLKSGLDGLFLGRFGHEPERFVKTVLEVAQA